MVHFLCEAGADKDRQAPLSFAAVDGHLDVVQLLCEAGADKGSQTRNGMTLDVPRCLGQCVSSLVHDGDKDYDGAGPSKRQRLA